MLGRRGSGSRAVFPDFSHTRCYSRRGGQRFQAYDFATFIDGSVSKYRVRVHEDDRWASADYGAGGPARFQYFRPGRGARAKAPGIFPPECFGSSDSESHRFYAQPSPKVASRGGISGGRCSRFCEVTGWLMSGQTLDSAVCAVLGGSGFLGQRLCRTLVNAGFHVRSVSRSGRPKAQPEPWWSRVEWVAAGIGTELSIRALEQADFVFHLVSTTLPSTSNSDIIYDLESNVLATVRILEAAASMQVRRIVFVSSGGTVYGTAQQRLISEHHPTDPICSYGIQKLAIEKYLQIFRLTRNLDSIVLRVSNLYGESQDCSRPLGAIAHFTDRAVKGIPIEIWGDGTTTRDYVHVDDVVSALFKCISYDGPERLFNIGSGRGVTLNELVEMLEERLARPVTVNYGPRRGFDVPENVLDISRAKHELSWRPEVPLGHGLERKIEAARAAVGELKNIHVEVVADVHPFPAVISVRGVRGGNEQ
jgi:UDP-glucose 4-epimerase